MRDLKSNVKTLVGFAPQAMSSTTDITGEIIDRQGYDSVTFVLLTDGISASSLAAQLLIQEDDDSAMGSAASVDDADLVGLESDTAITQSTDKAALKVGYRGNKRYVRAKLDISSNNGTDVVACVAILGHPAAAPVA